MSRSGSLIRTRCCCLRTTGTCTVSIPEWLYDLDCPGLYMRRIKTLALSIPSVIGPYTSVNCVLTLQRSTIRVSSLAGSGYTRDADNPDDRFVDYLGSTDEIVTSGGVNDFRHVRDEPARRAVPAV